MIRAGAATGMLALALAAAGCEESRPARPREVIYGRKHGLGLTMQVHPAPRPTGVGVIWVASGGWVSGPGALRPDLFPVFTGRGQTVFAVMHGSQPRFRIPEMLEDLEQAVRFTRAHAAEYGVDPDRLVIAGASSGGHLALMTAARNPELRAVACFYPPTDFANYGAPGVNGFTSPHLAAFRGAFPPAGEAARYSPALQPRMPPTLLLHGTEDRLVPCQQSQRFHDQMRRQWVVVRLDLYPGRGHEWPGQETDAAAMAEWFAEHASRGRK